jgi:hypothetical protein
MASLQPTAGDRGGVRRPTRRLVLAGLVPAVAAVAAGAVIVAVNAGQAGGGTTGARAGGGVASATANPVPGSAHDLFLVAATRSLSGIATSGSYWVVSTEHGESRQKGPASRPYNIMIRNSIEIWQPTGGGDETFSADQYLGAAPVTAADKAAWEADGSPRQWTEQPPSGLPDGKPIVIRAAAGPKYAGRIGNRVSTYPFAGGEMTGAQLATLPTDPTALRAWLVKRFKGQGNLEPIDYSLFWSGQALIFDLPVPPRVRAAAYRMLADVKGVQLLGPATDERGRSGMAVAYTRKGDGGWGQTRLIIDPRTGQPLADESWYLGNGKSAASTGQLMSYGLVLSAGFRNDAPPTGLPTPPAEK